MCKGVSGILVLRHARGLAEMNQKLICIGVFGAALAWFGSSSAAFIMVGSCVAVIALVLLLASWLGSEAALDPGFDAWGSGESSEPDEDREGGGDSADSGGDWGGGCD